MKKFAVVGVLFCSTFIMGMGTSVQRMVSAEAVRQGVPVSLAMAVAHHESNFNCRVVGRAGERGVMQIKPSTARSLGYRGKPSGLNNCQTGIYYGMKFLKMAYSKARGNTYRAALYYNGGLGTNRKKSRYADQIHQKTRRGIRH